MIDELGKFENNRADVFESEDQISIPTLHFCLSTLCRYLFATLLNVSFFLFG